MIISPITRKDVESALDQAGVDPEDYNIRDNYSGRGMWGGTCAAVDLPTGKLAAFLTALALVFAERGQEDEALDLADRACTDSMGLGIVIYWPDVTFTD